MMLLLMMLLLAFLPGVGATGDTGTGVAAMTGPAERDREAGIPFLRNYSPKEYDAAAPNWAIVQDKRGVIYVANNDGILEYDGTSWRLIRTRNKTVVRSLAMDDTGRVYVGAQGEFGYLAPDETGKVRFVSLDDRIEAQYRAFSDVWDTYATPQGVYFIARECIFLLAGGRIQAWKSSTGFHTTFYVQGRLFVRQYDKGLQELVGENLVMVRGGERFAQEKIFVMVPIDPPGHGNGPVTNGRILIGTLTQGFFLFDGASITPFPTEADVFLKNNLLYQGALMMDGTLALGTVQGGMVRLDRDGRVLGILDKALGLLDDSVSFVRPDGQSGLWLAQYAGVSHVEWPAPLTLFDERSGLKGTVLSLHRHKGTLYAGTGQGVFILEPALGGDVSGASQRCRFSPVAGLKSQSYGFLSFGEILLTTNFKGVFEIRGHDALLVRPSNILNECLYRSRSVPARVFVGLQDGLASVYRRNEAGGSWKDEGKIPGITEKVRNIVETEDGRLWLGTEAQGFLRVTFPKGWQGGSSGPAPLVERFGAEKGLNYQAYPFEGNLIFGTPQGLDLFDEAAKRFVPDPRFARLFLEGPRKVLALCGDSLGRLWMDSKDETNRIHEIGAAVPQPGGTYRWDNTPFLRITEMTINAIQADDDGVVWFGGSDGLVRYDPRVPKDYAPAYAVLIRRVDKAGGQPLFGGALEARGSKTIPALKYAENSLHFEFALPAFDQPEANRYQTRLEGLDQGWSAWTAQTNREYTNLPEGHYVFRVRARNVYGRESREGVFAFTVSPPWYRTWPAYLGFTVIGLGLLAGGIRAYTFKLHREKVLLEKLVAQRTWELKEASLTDPLTGLRNRRYIKEVLSDDVSAFVNFKKYVLAAKDRRSLPEQSRTVFGIVLFDLDHFKMVNDTYGHDAGDKVLQQLAHILKSSVRLDDAVMRIGGEEFLVVLKKTMPEYLETFTRKIKDKIQAHEFQLAEGLVLKRTCSIGYTIFPLYEQHPDRLSFEQTIMIADLGLYYAKEHGRNLAVKITPSIHMPDTSEDAQKMITSLDFALKHDYFQIKT